MSEASEETEDLDAIYRAIPRWSRPGPQRSELERLALHLGRAGVADLANQLQDLTPAEQVILAHHPRFALRPNQQLPIDDPNIRVIWASCGRGWGKGHAMSGAFVMEAMADPDARMALIAPSLPLAKNTNIWGPSGVLKLCPPWFTPRVSKGDRMLYFPNGAQLHWISGGTPDKIRGGQYSFTGLDELVAFERQTAVEALDEAFRTLRHVTPRMLELGLPARLMIATTPMPSEIFAALIRMRPAKMVIIRGSTLENHQLDADYLAMARRMMKTAKGRLEYGGVLRFGDVMGRPVFDGIDLERLRKQAPEERYDLISVTWDPVTGDPSLSERRAKRRDQHGLAVVGYRAVLVPVPDSEQPALPVKVLKADILHTEAHKAAESPSAVAERVVALAKSYGARGKRTLICYETNAGGKFVGSAIKQHDKKAQIWAFRTKTTKTDRALAVQPFMELEDVALVGAQPKLEAQIKAFVPGGSTNHAVDDVLDAVLLDLCNHLVPKSQARQEKKDPEGDASAEPDDADGEE